MSDDDLNDPDLLKELAVLNGEGDEAEDPEASLLLDGLSEEDPELLAELAALQGLPPRPKLCIT